MVVQAGIADVVPQLLVHFGPSGGWDSGVFDEVVELGEHRALADVNLDAFARSVEVVAVESRVKLDLVELASLLVGHTRAVRDGDCVVEELLVVVS